MCDDPFIYVWNLCPQKNTPAYKYYTDVMVLGVILNETMNIGRQV